jgi:APA family basic amino acid/polyamine antiporter
MPRPYKAIGYPVVPAIFVIAVAGFVINSLINDPIPTILTFTLILAGLPVYYFAFGSRSRAARR